MIAGVYELNDLIANCDGYTRDHCDKVTRYSLLIGARLGFSAKHLLLLRWEAQLHDVGKIGIGRDILNKPGKLTPEEYELMKRHTYIGSNIIEKFTNVFGLHLGALYHHEHYDGSGYPTGSRGNSIPIDARIIAVADAYDAMTSTRCYRPRCSEEYARSELIRGKGTQFDPQIVDVMIELLDEESAA